MSGDGGLYGVEHRHDEPSSHEPPSLNLYGVESATGDSKTDGPGETGGMYNFYAVHAGGKGAYSAQVDNAKDIEPSGGGSRHYIGNYGLYSKEVIEASNPVVRDVLGKNTVAAASASSGGDKPAAAAAAGAAADFDKTAKGIELAEKLPESIDWTGKFQTALDMPLATAEQEAKRAIAIRSVVSDFVQASSKIGKIIIDEVGLPIEKKTVKPSAKFGGIAGGVKYLMDGIIFKFAVDVQGIYGSDDHAMKAANHELRGLSTILAANIQGLQIPLMALVDYNGFRLVATSLLPIQGSKTLVYGTSDGGFTVLNKSPALDAKLRLLAATLNIKSHLSGGVDRKTGKLDPTTATLVHTCADLEGHLTADGRMYLVDAHRLFPPTHWGDRRALPGEQLYNLFRPEFVMTYTKPLNSDAFTGFALIDGPAHNLEIVEATKHLRETVIPKLALHLARTYNGLEQNLSFSEEAHRFGVNVRMLGLVRRQLFALIKHYDGQLSPEVEDKESKEAKEGKDGKDGKVEARNDLYPVLSSGDAEELINNAYSLTTALLMEMIARYLKCVLRAVMRSTTDAKLRNVALLRFFYYLDADRTAWNWMKDGIVEKFEAALLPSELKEHVKLRHRVDIFWIESRVQEALGLRLLKQKELGEVVSGEVDSGMPSERKAPPINAKMKKSGGFERPTPPVGAKPVPISRGNENRVTAVRPLSESKNSSYDPVSNDDMESETVSFGMKPEMSQMKSEPLNVSDLLLNDAPQRQHQQPPQASRNMKAAVRMPAAKIDTSMMKSAPMPMDMRKIAAPPTSMKMKAAPRREDFEMDSSMMKAAPAPPMKAMMKAASFEDEDNDDDSESLDVDSDKRSSAGKALSEQKKAPRERMEKEYKKKPEKEKFSKSSSKTENESFQESKKSSSEKTEQFEEAKGSAGAASAGAAGAWAAAAAGASGKQRSVPSYAAPSSDSITQKLAHEPVFNPDLVIMNIKMSPLFVVSRDVGYALLRQAKSSSGKEAISLCEKACVQFEHVYRQRPTDAATLAIWGEALALNASLHAHFPAQAGQLFEAAMAKFKQAVQIACTMRDRLAERVAGGAAAKAAAAEAKDGKEEVAKSAAPAVQSLAGTPAYKLWGAALLHQAVALLTSMTCPYGPKDIRLERIPQTSERAAALLVDACTKFEAAINETADDAEALYYWGCALQLRGTQAAAAPVSFSLEAKVDRAMESSGSASQLAAIGLLHSAEGRLRASLELAGAAGAGVAAADSDGMRRTLARTLVHLAQALFAWQRSSSGPSDAASYAASAEFRSLSPAQLLARAAELYRALAAQAGVTLASQLVEGPTSVHNPTVVSAGVSSKSHLTPDFFSEWAYALCAQATVSSFIAQSDRSSADVKAASEVALLAFKQSLECHELGSMRRKQQSLADASLAVVSALAVPVRQWTALGLWAQSLQAYSDCPLVRSTTATMLRKLRDAKTKETQEAEALWRRTAGLFVFKRIRYGNRASSPDTGSSFGRRIFKWAFFVEAVDGSPLDFISSVTIDLHPSFQTPRRVLTKQPFVLEGAGYGAFQTHFHFAFKSPFDKNEFSVVHMLTLNEGGKSKEMDFELSVQ